LNPIKPKNIFVSRRAQLPQGVTGSAVRRCSTERKAAEAQPSTLRSAATEDGQSKTLARGKDALGRAKLLECACLFWRFWCGANRSSQSRPVRSLRTMRRYRKLGYAIPAGIVPRRSLNRPHCPAIPNFAPHCTTLHHIAPIFELPNKFALFTGG